MSTITNHRFDGIPFKHLPHSINPVIAPKYITLHYSVTETADAAYQVLKNRRLSYHIIVDKDGSFLQCVNLNKRAWHSGKSNWKGVENLNSHSIGICMANMGFFAQRNNGLFGNVNAHNNPIGRFYKESEVLLGFHKNGGKERGWPLYPDEQQVAVRKICEALVSTYPSIRDIIGHDEISIGRKEDPGPAFPIESYYDLVPNRKQDMGTKMVVNTPNDTLSIRRGPTHNYKKTGELSDGQEVIIRSFAYRYIRNQNNPVTTSWASISTNSDMLHEGFINTKFLKPI